MKLKNLLFLGILISLSLRSWADTEPTNNVYTGADAMPENGTVSGSINTDPIGDTDDWYLLTTTSDGNITISFTCLPSSAYNRIYLYDSNGTTSFGSAEGSGSASLTVNGLSAGTYYVRYYYYSGSYASNYDLTNTVTLTNYANDVEVNDTYLTALTNLIENDSVYGHIGHRYNGGAYDTDDWYQFTTSTDGNISLTLSNETGKYNRIYLYDADGTTSFGSAEGTGGATFTKSGLAAGTYYARVYYYSSSYNCGYKLKAVVNTSGYANDTELNDTYLNALTSLNENDSVYGHIGYRRNGTTYDEDDWYQFTTSEDGNISLTLSTEPGKYNRIYLYDSDGTTSLGYNEGTGGATYTKTGLAAGTYYARVNYYSSTYFTGYKLNAVVAPTEYANDAEVNDSPAEALAMSENSTVYGHIGHRINGGNYDLDDWYQFTTTNDGSISLTLANNTGQYNRIYLYDSNGTTSLGYNDGYTGVTITKNGLAAGTYYARVYYYSSTYFSGYSLTATVTNADYTNDIEDNGSTATAVDMLTNSTMNGHIGHRINGGDYDIDDYYKIVTHSPGDITLNFTNTNGAYNRIYLYNSVGSSLGFEEGYGAASKTFSDLVAGTYYARMYYYSSTYFSSYALSNTFCPDAITIIAEGETTFCDGESVLLSTEDHHLNYLWSDGSTTETNAVTLSGDYSLQIDNGGGCVRTSNIINAESTPLPVAIISTDGPTEFCVGGDVILSVPSGPDAWLWSTGATTPTITVSTSGDYSVQLFKNSCSIISDPIAIIVNANPTPTITPDGPTTFCDGESVTLTSSAATSYLWSDGSTGSSVFADISDIFSVTVTDANGCTGTSGTTSVTENANPTAGISADGPTEFCSGGSVNLTATGGTSYLWSTGETTATINATTSDDYNCMVTDANGCSANTSTISVTVNANPTAGISADGATSFCNGGSVNLTATGGTSYLWSTGETTASINVTTGGDYSCSVTNAAGCSDISSVISVSVTPCGSVSISADGPTEFCDGGSVMLTSTEPTGNVWSTGETTQSITVSTSGDYSCVNGVNTSNTISVTVNPNPDATISADGDTEFCEGGSVSINAIADNDAYLWSNGATTDAITVSESGSYSVVITDDGCSSTSSTIDVTVNANPTPTISADGPTTFCAGSVNLMVDGSYSSYSWSTSETSSSINVSTSGSYTAMVTDANGCSGISNSIEVTEGTAPTVSVSTDDNTLLCYNATVEIIADASSGNLQWYNYGFIMDGETSASLFVSAAGRYTCIATDGDCSTTSNEIAIHKRKSITIAATSSTVCVGIVSATITVADVPGATYQWYKNMVAISGADNYTYTTDAFGNYYCIVSKGGCDRISKIQKLVSGCRVSNENEYITVYPNPAAEFFTLNYFSTINLNSSIQILNMQGQIVFENAISIANGSNTYEINTVDFPSGVYQITIQNENGITIQERLVIEK